MLCGAFQKHIFATFKKQQVRIHSILIYRYRNLLGTEALHDSVIYGEIVDRAATGGDLIDVHGLSPWHQTPSLFEQFPLVCDASGWLAVGRKPAFGSRKVLAYRAYLRLSRDGRAIVPPDIAEEYYGGCNKREWMQSDHHQEDDNDDWHLESKVERCYRPYLEASKPTENISGNFTGISDSKQRNEALVLQGHDMFNYTPYALHRQHYFYSSTPVELLEASKDFKIDLWYVQNYEGVIPIHRFRWHVGIFDVVRLRLNRYRGTCDVSSPEQEDCTPLLPGWRRAAAAYGALLRDKRINIDELNCVQSPSGAAYHVNTTKMGMAWEQFEPGLMVKPKLRYQAGGDSQSRQATKDKIFARDETESDGY